MRTATPGPVRPLAGGARRAPPIPPAVSRLPRQPQPGTSAMGRPSGQASPMAIRAARPRRHCRGRRALRRRWLGSDLHAARPAGVRTAQTASPACPRPTRRLPLARPAMSARVRLSARATQWASSGAPVRLKRTNAAMRSLAPRIQTPRLAPMAAQHPPPPLARQPTLPLPPAPRRRRPPQPRLRLRTWAKARPWALASPMATLAPHAGPS
mmetsp:Transcript_226/g.795  ORF Transcript_226/g.795 Transcript_226/m.795 type:complete len:211 (-) Transcript_226:494-1126(-)